MRLHLHGGFGEKGRTSLVVESANFRLLLDVGVMTSAHGTPQYYPQISREQLAAVDALLITHGHEDHSAALGWCIANGFTGPIYMTPEAQRDTRMCLADYAAPDEAAQVPWSRVIELPAGGQALRVGPLRVLTGRSGHIAGGVWCQVMDADVRLTYCGDMMSESPVFAMDALPQSDIVLLDASYGDDDIPAADRARDIAAWVSAHPQGCVLPTPLYGRSAELLAVIPGDIALAPGMRGALREQLNDERWLSASAAQRLSQRLATTRDWHTADPLPRAALICHDGMGLSGPSKVALARARDDSHPVLLTGHVPAGTAGQALLNDRRADWIRLPTHPRLAANVAMAEGSGASLLVGHSCEPLALERLGRHLPRMRADLRTGDTLDL
ncbi:MAG: MBL fold metallo-hydrolase [Pseudomonadota bacterium]|nr:MBL fold metallo-hydrolase [Pseudomonadota bacterium]